MFGTVLCIFAMLLLGFTRGVASIFTEKDSSSVRRFPLLISHAELVQNDSLTIWLAVLAIYLIDFAINAGLRHSASGSINSLTFPTVQALDRALIVDTLPPSSQAAANAWAARMLSIGSVVGFFASVSHALCLSNR